MAAELLSVAEQVEEKFIELFELYDVANAPERKKADVIDSLWNDIYIAIFKPRPEDKIYNNCKSRLKTYDVVEVEEVVNVFIKLCKRYGGVIKINQFCNLTGIHRATLWLWNDSNKTNGYIFNLDDTSISEENKYIYIINNGNNNISVYKGNNRHIENDNLSSLRFDVIKKLREEMQDSNTNGLSNDTMGHSVRANNEVELGKLYEPRRMLQQATIKHALSDSELPKLSVNGTQLAIGEQKNEVV